MQIIEEQQASRVHTLINFSSLNMSEITMLKKVCKIFLDLTPDPDLHQH